VNWESANAVETLPGSGVFYDVDFNSGNKRRLVRTSVVLDKVDSNVGWHKIRHALFTPAQTLGHQTLLRFLCSFYVSNFRATFHINTCSLWWNHFRQRGRAFAEQSQVSVTAEKFITKGVLPGCVYYTRVTKKRAFSDTTCTFFPAPHIHGVYLCQVTAACVIRQQSGTTVITCVGCANRVVREIGLSCME